MGHHAHKPGRMPGLEKVGGEDQCWQGCLLEVLCAGHERRPTSLVGHHSGAVLEMGDGW